MERGVEKRGVWRDEYRKGVREALREDRETPLAATTTPHTSLVAFCLPYPLSMPLSRPRLLLYLPTL